MAVNPGPLPWVQPLKPENSAPIHYGCVCARHFSSGKCCLASIFVVNFLFCPSSTCCCISPLMFWSSPSLTPLVRRFLSVQSFSSFMTPSPRLWSLSPNHLSLFHLYLLPYLILRKLACLFGSLGSSACIQKLFCRSCSTCRLIFDVFVCVCVCVCLCVCVCVCGGVIPLSYSSSILKVYQESTSSAVTIFYCFLILSFTYLCSNIY